MVKEFGATLMIFYKRDKSFEYLYKQLEPGAVTTLRQIYSAYTGVPYKGEFMMNKMY